MLRNYIIALPFLTAFSFPAQAEPSPDEIETTSTACQDAFIAKDAEAYVHAASTMLSWGEMQNPELARKVELCLAFADAIQGVDLELVQKHSEVATASDHASEITNDSGTTEPNDRLAKYLSQIKNDDVDMEALAVEIAEDSSFSPTPSPDRDALENQLKAYVRPIPAARAEQNLVAYRALARINPDEQTYRDRIARYKLAIEEKEAQLERTAQQLEKRLIRYTAEFDGSSWSRHPSSPRYQDIRNYVTLYLLESGAGTQSMELFVNYTSRTGWLFVESASINIDGEVSRIPISHWSRDNDSEIWEYGGVQGIAALNLARKIAESDRSVIRFNGRDFYDDHVVSKTDKKVLQEMLAMWEIISPQ